MSPEFNQALLCFIADCMSVAEMHSDTRTAIQEMATRANKTFAGFTPTPDRVSEVKTVILQVAA